MKLFSRKKWMSTIGAQDTMLNVITTEALPADDIRGLAEKSQSGTLLRDTALYPQGNDTIQHKRIVQIDPKCQPRVPIWKSRWIEGTQFSRALTKIIIKWTGAQGSIVHAHTIIPKLT